MREKELGFVGSEKEEEKRDDICIQLLVTT